MFDFLTATVREYRIDLRRRWWVVVAVVVGAVAAGVLPVVSAADVYSASLQLRNSYANPSPSIGDPDDFNAQYVEFGSDLVEVNSSSMRSRVVEQLGTELPMPFTVRAVLVPLTTTVVIDVRAPSAAEAAQVAQAFGEVFVAQRTERVLGPLDDAIERSTERVASIEAEIDTIDGQLADESLAEAFRGSLRVRRASLVIDARHERRANTELIEEADIRSERIRITSDAVAGPDPIGQNPIRVGVLAGVLGLLIGMAIAIGIGRFEAMRAVDRDD